MHVNIISPDGMQVTGDLERDMEAKFAPLEKIYNRITGFEVTLKRLDNTPGKNCMVEGRALLSKSSFFCREKASTFEAALDQVIEDLTRQLKRQMEQRTEIW